MYPTNVNFNLFNSLTIYVINVSFNSYVTFKTLLKIIREKYSKTGEIKISESEHQKLMQQKLMQ